MKRHFNKLNIKVLSLLFFTIVIALGINSFIYYSSVKEEYLENFFIQSELELNILKANIESEKNKLKKISENLVSEKYIIDNMAMLSNYKNNHLEINNEKEKRRLLDFLNNKLENNENISYRLFDKYGNPTVVNAVYNLKKEKGIFTNKNKNIQFIEIPKNKIKENEFLHKLEYKKLDKILISLEKNSIGLTYLKRIYKNNQLVGYLNIKKIYNAKNIRELIQSSSFLLSFISDNLNFGTIKVKNKSYVLAKAISFESKLHNKNELIFDENYFYHTHYLLNYENKKLFFVVAVKKDVLTNKINKMITELIFSVVISLIISFSIAFYYLKKYFIVRLEEIINGIKKIENKEFFPFKAQANDEFDEVADELNNLTKIVDNSFKEIEKLNEYLQRIINTVPVRIFWKDREGKYLGANVLFVKDAKLNSLEELLGKDDFEMPWADTEGKKYRADDKFVMENNKAKLLIEETQTKENGDVIYVLTSKVPLHDSKNNVIGILGVYEDITKQKNIQQELKDKESILFEQSKLAAMGEMLENIAHQWRQPLSIITTSATGIEINKSIGNLSDEVLEEHVHMIVKSANHLSQTIEDFRDFYKRDKEANSIDIKELVLKSISLLDSKLKYTGIEIVFDELESIFIKGYKNELIQVFINILNNSIDEFKGDKTKKIKTIVISSKKTYNILTVSIKDSAGGISEDIIPNIFDYKFTTKEKKNGTGIGLYMSRLILEKSGASITVKNTQFEYNGETQKGAQFDILFLIYDNKLE